MAVPKKAKKALVEVATAMDRWGEVFAPIKLTIEVVEAQANEKAAPKGKKGA